MATSSTPSSAICRRSLWRSDASGVVRRTGAGWPLMVAPNVPMRPNERPAARAIASSAYVTVVLPLVPVIPITVIDRDGWWCTAAAANASARRVSSTRIWGYIDIDVILDQCCRRPSPAGSGYECVAVDAEAADGREEASGSGVAAVVHNVGDGGRAVSEQVSPKRLGDRGHGDGVSWHRDSPPFGGAPFPSPRQTRGPRPRHP